MAGANTIGLGLGVILLIVLWTITAFLWVLLSRSQTTLRIVVTTLALLLTFSLFLIPTSEGGKRISLQPSKTSYELYDYMFVLRAVLIIILFISVAAAVAIHLSQFWSVKVHGSDPVPKKRQESLLVDYFK
ncbi:unnamed protein product [Orchesella dallaii]|uniref:Transmembrane protein 218 n=1 Tax=Orchesella dallaii TaxID=48710 RepID=A0ABP1QSV2_9HEXA